MLVPVRKLLKVRTLKQKIKLKRNNMAEKKSKTVKDACYTKVKATYKVFPSAYASGAIAKCRKAKAKK